MAQGAALPPGYVLDPPSNPYDKYRPIEKLGPGPHTLIIMGPNGVTKIEYANGTKCLKARNDIRRQTGTEPNQPIISAYPKTFCVPR